MPRKITKIGWLLIFLLCVLPTFAQKSQRRVALVLGNNYYDSPRALTNQNTDAFDVAEALTDLGFEVLRGFNLKKQQTENLIEVYSKKLSKTGGTGLFYYTGTSFHWNGENYLVPVDANFKDLEEVVKTSVSIRSLLSQNNFQKNALSLILLDAAQKNPYTSQTLIFRDTDYLVNGFTKITPPKNTIVFYSAADGRTALIRCGRNGYFADSLLNVLKNEKLEFRQMATNISEEIKQKTANLQQPYFEGALPKRLYLVDKKNKLKPKKAATLENLFTSYKELKKCECGTQDGAISIGKEIIAKYKNDKQSVEVIKFVKNDIAKIEKEDPICRRNQRYNSTYKAKIWHEFFAVSKEIIEQEENQGLVLDVMLTLVSTGFDRAAVDKVDIYNNDTINFAKIALQKIESGKASKTGKWGVFVPFLYKENALSWMHYIIGWQMYYKTNQKKEALGYLYKSAQIGNEKKNDISIYTNIGTYYYDEAVRLDGEYRDKRKANNNEDNDETKALLALARGTTDRAIDAFGRAYQIAVKSKANNNFIEALKKNLDDLYRFRFDIPPDVKPEGVEIYFEKLISQPMPDPSTKVESVLQ